MDSFSDSPPKVKDAWKKLCFCSTNSQLMNSRMSHFSKCEKKFTPSINSSTQRKSSIFNYQKKRVSHLQGAINRQTNRKNSTSSIGFKELQIDSGFRTNFRSIQRNKKTILKPSSFIKREIVNDNSFLLNLSDSKLNISLIKNKTSQQLMIVKNQLAKSKKEVKALKRFINCQLGQFYRMFNHSFMAMQQKYQDKTAELLEFIDKIKPPSDFTIPQDQSEISEKTQFTNDPGDKYLYDQLKNYLNPLKLKRLGNVNQNQRQFSLYDCRNSINNEIERVKLQKRSQFKNIKGNQTKNSSNNSFYKMFAAIDDIKKDLDDIQNIAQRKRNPLSQILQNFESIKQSQNMSNRQSANKNFSKSNAFEEFIYKKSLRA